MAIDQLIKEERDDGKVTRFKAGLMMDRDSAEFSNNGSDIQLRLIQNTYRKFKTSFIDLSVSI